MAAPVLVLTGPPGAGKTTVARLLANRTRLGVHLEADTFFHFVAAGYVEPWRPQSHAQNVTVMGAVAAAAASYADGGYETTIEGIVIPRWFLAPLRAALEQRGHAVRYAVLRPTLEACRARVARRGGRELSDPDVIQRLWDEFADLGSLERNVIAAGDGDAQAAADAVHARLQDGTLTIGVA